MSFFGSLEEEGASMTASYPEEREPNPPSPPIQKASPDREARSLET